MAKEIKIAATGGCIVITEIENEGRCGVDIKFVGADEPNGKPYQVRAMFDKTEKHPLLSVAWRDNDNNDIVNEMQMGRNAYAR